VKTLTKYSFILVIFYVFAICFAGCTKTEEILPADLEINDSSADEFVIGASDQGLDVCVTDSGVFYMENHNLRYLDLETNRSFVLCSRVNCSHNDYSCPAYYSADTITTDNGDVIYDMTTGLAMYRGNIFVMKTNVTTGTLDLVLLDPTNDTQKVISSLDIGDGSVGSLYLFWISNINHAGNTAWFLASYA